MEDARHSASSSGFHMYTHTAVYPRAYPTLYTNTPKQDETKALQNCYSFKEILSYLHTHPKVSHC